MQDRPIYIVILLFIVIMAIAFLNARLMYLEKKKMYADDKNTKEKTD